jgi:hypothetical protein
MSMMNGSDPEDITAGMARLEAALDRIDTLSGQAQLAGGGPIVAAERDTATPSDPVSTEVLDHLDRMISRLRAAIDEA